MRHSATAPLSPAARLTLSGVLALAVVAASGCSWFNKEAGMYAMSEETRPLEVPPDLDLPETSGALAVPAEPTSVLRSETGATTTAAASAAASSGGFNVAMPADQAFVRVGELLAGVEGLEIASKAQLLGAYDVSYGGANFLVRVTAVQGGSYISAVDPRGVPATGEAATNLMAALQAAMTGG